MNVLENVKELRADKWGTLNTAGSPNKLPEGNSPNHQNVWVDEKAGSIITANGYIKLGTLPSNLPPTTMIDFFKGSDGTSRVVISDGQNVYQTTDYVTYTTIKTGLSPFFQLRGKVIRDKLWLTNGSDAVLVWNGSSLTTLDGSGGTPNVPKGKFIEYHDERVWLYGINGDLSSLRFTALTDSSGTEIPPDDAAAWPTDNELQISEGDADIGTGIFLFRGYLYCSKQYSLWRIVGSDEYTYSRVKTRSSTGTRFQESIGEKDNLIHFIGVDGLYIFDGEDSKRVSDPIDPFDPAPGVFAFRNLQQPLLNNQFWNVSDTSDFSTGTVPVNLSTDNDELTLIPADDSQANFNAGTLVNTTADDNPGSLQLAIVNSGQSGSLVSNNKTPAMNSGGMPQVGLPSYITDGNNSNYVGFKSTIQNSLMQWDVDLGSALRIGKVTIRDFYVEAQGATAFIISAKIQYSNDNTNWTDAANLTLPTSVSGTGFLYQPPATRGIIGPTDATVSFTTVNARYWRLLTNQNSGEYVVIREMEIYLGGYQPFGSFASKTIDLGATPATFGSLVASIASNGEAFQFGTQSSSDGVTWDAIVNVANGGAIASVLKRYLRWTVSMTSSTGTSSPVVDKVYVGSTYLSEIHDTGGNIYQWGAFSASIDKAGQTVNFYYRAGSSSAVAALQPWTAIVPGAIPAALTSSQFIQIKAELDTTDSTMAPSISSFTVNWILANGTGINTLQNVASIVILNRYWLSAATKGASGNDIVIVLGKSTAGSPFHKKDFQFLSFCRFQDYYIAGSSVDGSIYRLESGYSKAGVAMDAYYETSDFVNDSFQFKGKELNVALNRSGSYNLSVGWSTDGGVTYLERLVDLTRTLPQALSFIKKLNISFMSERVRFRVRINAADQPFSVDSLQCFYRPDIERGTLEPGDES